MDHTDADPGGTTRTSGRSRLRRGLERVFSLRAFLFAVALVAVGMFAGNAVPVPLVGWLAGLVGIAVAGFAIGLAGRSRYVETTLAGGVVAGAAALLDYLVVSLLGLGVPIVALGAGTGALAALVGHYFGRDLRAGLTRDVGGA